jgi:organic hydroperoxide reductase OsmC/OhrA
MHEYPHHYRAAAQAGPENEIATTSPALTPITATAPPEFGGPEGYWSPETLLVASVADCFILTFRAIARASKLEWTDLQCDAEGILERVDRVTRFTRFNLRAVLVVPTGTRQEKCLRLMNKSEQNCLVTRSLNAEVHLDASVKFV